MRFKGIHRKPRELRDASSYASSPPESGQQRPETRHVRPRSNQPRDRFGRFRKAGRDDDFAVRADAGAGQAVDAAPAPRRPGGRRTDTRPAGYSWRDFELEEEPPLRAEPHPPDVRSIDGRRHCGLLENILHRQWDARLGPPSAEVVRAVDSLAALPPRLKEKLATGLDGIYVGPGGVPQLDDMGHLRDRPLPSGRATWDICAGAYGDRKIVVGDRPSPTPDVMMHEVGHALDDIDGEGNGWQSDSPAFRALYEQCLPYLASDFHRQPHDLGRREFFADAFAAISARQRPALVDMLAGNIRAALDVMLFFNRRYGI
ncbi:hypothetical protein J4573_30530 [Actinomadura barringtoniae]|uniref:Uncharacterized protein n=1 Tax=Actinomadura barringtoniae TaxID=1427535 RepID=A0A939T9J5_9ACTN|nr:hypothetical protein [Actinomadura barringtoniae]MBO2451462.1 hypothetical protein [Actinomadura barringtoniae]